MKAISYLFILFLFPILSATAQTNTEQTGWGAIFHSQKLSDKWGLHFDAQFRSADNWENIRHTLIRPGITYHLNQRSNITAGYLLVLQNTPATAPKNLSENRIWEQYVISHKLWNIPLAHRFRLEQRFIGRYTGDDLFSQRLRYFFRSVNPLTKTAGQPFEKGAFFALQNEIFLNLQNKDDLNGHVFDQNRAYAAIGYRFCKHFDAEAGYLNQTVKGASTNTVNHVAQLALYTRF